MTSTNRSGQLRRPLFARGYFGDTGKRSLRDASLAGLGCLLSSTTTEPPSEPPPLAARQFPFSGPTFKLSLNHGFHFKPSLVFDSTTTQPKTTHNFSSNLVEFFCPRRGEANKREGSILDQEPEAGEGEGGAGLVLEVGEKLQSGPIWTNHFANHPF